MLCIPMWNKYHKIHVFLLLRLLLRFRISEDGGGGGGGEVSMRPEVHFSLAARRIKIKNILSNLNKPSLELFKLVCQTVRVWLQTSDIYIYPDIYIYYRRGH